MPRMFSTCSTLFVRLSMWVYQLSSSEICFTLYDKRGRIVTLLYHLPSFYTEIKSLRLIDAKPKEYDYCCHAIFNLGVAFVFSPWQSPSKLGVAHLAYRKRWLRLRFLAMAELKQVWLCSSGLTKTLHCLPRIISKWQQSSRSHYTPLCHILILHQ